MTAKMTRHHPGRITEQTPTRPVWPAALEPRGVATMTARRLVAGAPSAAHPPSRPGSARIGAQPSRHGDEPLPAAAPRQPGRLVGVAAGGVRGGRPPRRPGVSLGGLLRVPLVPRHGPRVVRGRRGGAGPQRGVRLGQGRPRGAPRRRRGLHGRHPGADRPGRVADDGVDDAGAGAVLLRHLLPQATAAAGPRRGLRRLADAPRRGAGQQHPHRGRPARGDRSAAPRAHHRASRGCRRGVATPVRQCARRDSAAPRSSHRPCSWSSCSATTPAPGTRAPWRWRRRRARPWLAAASTTSWPAGSRGTPSTSPGSCRTSRRCFTTTPSSCGSTPTGGGRRGRRSPSASPGRRPTSCSVSSGRLRAPSPVPSTPTRPVSKASRTRGAAPARRGPR